MRCPGEHWPRDPGLKLFWAYFSPLTIHPFIAQKRDRGTHSPKDISSFVEALVAGRLADYQVSAWLMAAYINGLDESETSALAMALANSGETIDQYEGDTAASRIDHSWVRPGPALHQLHDPIAKRQYDDGDSSCNRGRRPTGLVPHVRGERQRSPVPVQIHEGRPPLAAISRVLSSKEAPAIISSSKE